MDDYSDIARRVVVLGLREGERHQQIAYSTPLALHGIIAHEENDAFRLLVDLVANVSELRDEVLVDLRRRAALGGPERLPFTVNMKKALSVAMESAGSLGFNYVGILHILLGLVEVSEGTAGRILRSHSVTLEQVFSAVNELEREAG